MAKKRGMLQWVRVQVRRDGEFYTTLKGDRIVPEFLDILNNYVSRTYATDVTNQLLPIV